MIFTNKAITVGSENKGDVSITLELIGTTRDIEIKSKLSPKFNASIQATINYTLDIFKISGIKLLIIDQGTYNFAIKARLETALKRISKLEGADL
ncbi:citrate lyase acyl carrier protein [Veillonella sp. R32]|uniref:citrate lyase acyl carrier protein n=1 Tax=Veillonella sp. R32 TaxID=2021312 RepID=UPI001389A66C|nr:citrate lyase acyl carrier protein [Veillonella sp. R32]KAF1682059.1 hypothetical protein VER_06810 [Veillonella sp. R32]